MKNINKLLRHLKQIKNNFPQFIEKINLESIRTIFRNQGKLPLVSAQILLEIESSLRRI